MGRDRARTGPRAWRARLAQGGLALALGASSIGTAHADPTSAPSSAPAPAASPTPAPSRSHHEVPLVFVLDPKLGMEAGIRTFNSVGRVVYRYDEAIPPVVAFDEHRPLGRFGAIVGRTAQWLFIDEPIAELESTSIHEVFGHGARARDLGLKSRFDFALPGIYCVILDTGDCTSHATATLDTTNRDRDLLRVAGGVEANHLTTYWVDLNVVRARGWVHEGDLVVYGASRLAYAQSFLSSKLDVAGELASRSDDIDAYVTLLQDRYNLPLAADRHRISSRLRAAYVWNLADPMLAYAAYAVFYRGVGRGERWTKAPLPTIGDTTFYAAPRFGLTPFGAEHYVDLFLGRGSSVLALYGRAGSSGLASYTGAGARAVGLRVHDRLSLGGELDVWSQPETLLEDRFVYERPQRRGMNAAISGDWRILGRLGLTGKLGYKSRGFLAGQPIDDGPYGYVGASIALDGDASLPRRD